MEIMVSFQVNVCLPDDQTIPIESLVNEVKGQKIEAKILEKILACVDNQVVTTLCGEKYTKRSDNTRYLRAGTTRRTIVSSVGAVCLKVTKIRDIGDNRIIKPLFNVIQLSGKKKYQTELLMISVDFAQKLSYRDTVEELSMVVPDVPSRMTINHYVEVIGKEIPVCHPDAQFPVVLADGTKTHSQEPGIKQNEVNVVLGVQDTGPVLLGITVNQEWRQLSDSLVTEHALSDSVVVVSDGERELRVAFMNEHSQFQTDLIHGFRILGFKLWEDTQLSLDERKRMINELKSLLLSLKNVVVNHVADTDRIGRKINEVVDEIHELAAYLTDVKCWRSAKFLNEYSNTLVTFARLAVNGVHIPWNSNMIERLMGEISKRVKHKWMRWTTSGLEAILRLILVRYTEPGRYRAFRNMKLGRTDASGVTVNIVVSSSAI